MPLAGVAWSPWFFWDGRRDSLWAQALTPLEDQAEHAGTRAGYAHFIAENSLSATSAFSGRCPTDRCPRSAGPRGTAGRAGGLGSDGGGNREDVDRVFANLGKAMATFERSILP